LKTLIGIGKPINSFTCSNYEYDPTLNINSSKKFQWSKKGPIWSNFILKLQDAPKLQVIANENAFGSFGTPCILMQFPFTRGMNLGAFLVLIYF
jgi:hypothetical protein